MSPVKHINAIKGKFYYGFKCSISKENYAFLLLSSILLADMLNPHNVGFFYVPQSTPIFILLTCKILATRMYLQVQ